MNILTRSNFLRFNKLVILLPMICLLFIGQTLAQEKEKKKKKTKPFEVEFGLSAFYDDNILKYSDKYLERFLNNQDQGRFQIETYDDIVLKPALRLASSFNVFKKRRSRINFAYNYSLYTINNVKNWNFIGVGFQQALTKKASLRISYSYIPEFYVRHFRDSDWVEIYRYTPVTFQPFSFSKDDYGFWIQNNFFKNTRLRLTFNYMKYFHNEHFTEYDCDNLRYGIEINQPVGKKLKLDFGYEYTTSDAKGYDEPGETKYTSDDADATYVEDGFSFGFSWQMPVFYKLKHVLDGGVVFDKRYYTTNNYVELDPEHAGRVDQNLNFYFSYLVDINKAINLSAFYKWYGRNSGSPSINDEYLSVEKDYKQNQIGLEFTYKFKF